MEKLPTGAAFLDHLLNGGYEREVITTIYGPSGTGKTNFCLLAAVKVAESGKKVVFIDTEGGIAIERIKQLNPNYEEILKNILFFSPVNFIEQKEVFEKIRELIGITKNIGIIIVDSISMLYRLELGKSEEVYEVNSSLGKQIGYLVEISRRNKIPTLITNQVYADFANPDKIKMVGGDLLKYGSKCLLELQKTGNHRRIILKKHRSLPENIEAYFKIVSTGVELLEN